MHLSCQTLSCILLELLPTILPELESKLLKREGTAMRVSKGVLEFRPLSLNPIHYTRGD